MLGLLATLALMLSLLGLASLQRKFRALQYLFFLRHPIWIGVVGCVLPVVSSYSPAAGLLDNLYVLDHGVAALWVGMATAWLFVVVWLGGELIFRAGDERFGLPFARSEDSENKWANDHWLERKLGAGQRRVGVMILFALASMPMLIVLGLRNTEAVSRVALAALGYTVIVVGLILEGKHRPLARVTEPLMLFQRLEARMPHLQARITKFRAGELLRGYGDKRGHQVVMLLLGATSLAYIFGAIVLAPWHDSMLVRQIPAVAYLLLLLTLGALVLPAISLFLDVYRVPTFISIAILLLPLHMQSDHDYYFAAPERELAEPVDPRGAVTRRFEAEPEPILVVVASSGGGGQASVWTSRVLEGLAGEGEWGQRVLDSVALVSTVSGGSIGAMYWVDGYTIDGPPSDPESLERLRAAAEGPVLEAMVWGMVYPDFVRMLMPAISQAWFPLLDRARTMELTWNARSISGEVPTLASWSQGVREGWRPLLIFNATAVESGCRVLFGAASLAPDDFAGAMAYPVDEYDIEVATAARLSASFPYLSPTSRAEVDVVRERSGTRKGTARRCNDLEISGQHIVDGGYYDNYGIVTAMQWLDLVLSNDRERRFRKVVIIEIRSMSKQFQRSEIALTGLVAQLAGPLITLMSVRTSSQIDRNVESLEQFAAIWADRGVTIETIPFEAHNEQRLSWTLTHETIARIRANWTDDPEILCQRRRLCELVGGRDCPDATDCR